MGIGAASSCLARGIDPARSYGECLPRVVFSAAHRPCFVHLDDVLAKDTVTFPYLVTNSGHLNPPTVLRHDGIFQNRT